MIGLAVAMGNVLIPGIIIINFPLIVGLMTGLYAVFMNIFGALGSGLSAPMPSWGLGWQGALAIWGILTVITFFIGIPQLKKQKQRESVQVDVEKNIKQVCGVHLLHGV